MIQQTRGTNMIQQTRGNARDQYPTIQQTRATKRSYVGRSIFRQKLLQEGQRVVEPQGAHALNNCRKYKHESLHHAPSTEREEIQTHLNATWHLTPNVNLRGCYVGQSQSQMRARKTVIARYRLSFVFHQPVRGLRAAQGVVHAGRDRSCRRLCGAAGCVQPRS